MWRSGFGNFVEGVGDGKDQVADTSAGGCGDGVEGQIAFGAKAAQFIEMRTVGGGIELCSDDDHGLFAERGAEGEQLAANDFVRVDGIGVGEIAGIDQVNEEPRALDVPQEANTKTGAFVRTFDQAGQIGHNEGPADVVAFFSGSAAGGLRNAVGADATEIGLKSSEWIVGN